MPRLIVAAILLACAAPAGLAADAPQTPGKPQKKLAGTPAAPIDPRLTPPPDKLDLKDGDTLVFLGDSITHQCLYTQFVEDYLYTRFPKQRLQLRNAGVSGDTAGAALVRFDMDVAAYKPKYVSILLGMNDGGYKQWDPQHFAAYEKGMLELLDRIKSIGATAIVMGPTMFDRNAILMQPQGDKTRYDQELGRSYNAVVSYYGAFMRDQALERGLNYVDMAAPMNQLSMERRHKDPNFTMVPDCVHPNANGQAVMATAMIDALHLPRPVSTTNAAFNADKGWKVTISGGGSATDVQGDTAHLTFTSLEPCLPWVLPDAAAVGYELSLAGHIYSGQPFTVQGLQPGNYTLKIDDQLIGTFSSSDLAFKIELQRFSACPQHALSLALAMLNKEKNEKAVQPIRNLYLTLKIKRLDPKTTPEALAAFIDDMKTKVADLEKAQAAYERRIYEMSQPVPHKYELTKVN